MMKQITEIADARLVKGLAHPLRIEILRVLEEGIASPSELAERIDAPLGNVSYHVRFLARVGLIELCDTRPRRGAVEHYYRTVSGVRVTDAAWAQMPGAVRDSLLSATLDQVGQSVGAAAAAGGFDHDRASATRLELTLDAAGFAALSAAVSELHERALTVERESARRLAADAGECEGAPQLGADPGRSALQIAAHATVAGRLEDKIAAGVDGKAHAQSGGGAPIRSQLVLMMFDSAVPVAA
jgi:DNA-binding transcriptional ArsR family regulator